MGTKTFRKSDFWRSFICIKNHILMKGGTEIEIGKE